MQFLFHEVDKSHIFIPNTPEYRKLNRCLLDNRKSAKEKSESFYLVCSNFIISSLVSPDKEREFKKIRNEFFVIENLKYTDEKLWINNLKKQYKISNYKKRYSVAELIRRGSIPLED